MATPPKVTAVKFGEWLQLQRGDRALEQIARRLHISKTTLFHYERGRVPHWDMLRALSYVYQVPFKEMGLRLMAALEFSGARDLFCPTEETLSKDIGIVAPAYALSSPPVRSEVAAHDEGRSAPSRVQQSLLTELGFAAHEFHELSIRFDAWAKRLADAAADAGLDLTSIETPSPRPHPTSRAVGDRTHGGSPTRPSRKKR